MATQNPYSDSLLMDALRGSLSNAESLGRGFAVAPVGLLGDINALGRQYITPRLPQGVQSLLQSAPAAPTTEQILSNIPRVSNPRMETAGMEQLGAAMNPRGPVDLAKGVGRVAGNAINEAMVYDRGLLAGVTPQPMRMDVYHGTPHRFDAFDASKIGTGEGAQAFGHGLYFGEARNTGEEYRKILSANSMSIDGKPIADKITNFEIQKLVGEYSQDLPKLKQELNNYVKEFSDNPYADISSANKIAKAIDENKFKVGTEGYLYKVDLPDEAIAKMLDLDKPVSKQPTVMNALRSEAEQRVRDRQLADIENNIRGELPKQEIGNDYMAMFSDANVAINQDIQAQAMSKLNKMDLKDLVDKELDAMKPVDMNWNMTGKEFYELLSNREGSPEKASAMLQSQGVTGNRYLDQGSRVVSGGELLDVFQTPSGWKSKIKVTNRAGVAFDSPTDTFTTSMPFKTEDEARQWAIDKIGGGTSNFVVFPKNEGLLTIKEINDQPVQGLLGR